jgi:putative two-component system response regulator
MRVLIAEDDADSLDLIEHALAVRGYDVTRARDGLEALELVRTGQFRIVISDWEMPGLSGVELCREVRRRIASAYVYFILLTSRKGTPHVIDGLKAGADEFLTKPFDPHELYVRLRVAERILALESRDVTIFSLAKLAEARDPETGAHLERIRTYCCVLAEHLAQLPRYRDLVDGDFVQLLYLTSPLHDIGKVGIPDSVLLKPGRLTAEEFEVMKRHTLIGGDTLGAAAQAYSEARYLQMAREIALTHHEKFDGTGYPYGLRGEAIPLTGRIVAVSDVYDALTTARVYKPAYSHDVAREIIVEGKGRHFDPALVEAFLAHEERIIEIHRQLEEAESTGLDLAPGGLGAELAGSHGPY